MDRIDEIIQFWFGNSIKTSLPSQNRTHIWFAKDQKFDAEIRQKFSKDVQQAADGELSAWEQSPRGNLALILLLDQFSRNIFRGTDQAYAQDEKALDICLRSLEQQFDHSLSLLERAFFYMPLMHAESKKIQTLSVRAFQMLVDLSFPETQNLFKNFHNYAVQHYEIIKQFDRFPHRNATLGRDSTEEELTFLKQPKSSF